MQRVVQWPALACRRSLSLFCKSSHLSSRGHMAWPLERPLPMRHILTSLIVLASLANPFKFLVRPASPAQKVTSSIVRIIGVAEGHPYSCTGFVVAPKKVLSAAHCNGESYMFDGFSARLVKKDEYYDLALFDVNEELKPSVSFRDEDVTVGEGLTAIGYGYGWEIPLILSEKVTIPSYPVNPGGPVGIIVQGPYVGGMSGGPVIDGEARVVGMVQQATSTIGFGVGVRFIKAFLFDCGIKL